MTQSTLVTGSYSFGMARPGSDLDIEVIVPDDMYAAIAHTREELARQVMLGKAVESARRRAVRPGTHWHSPDHRRAVVAAGYGDSLVHDFWRRL